MNMSYIIIKKVLTSCGWEDAGTAVVDLDTTMYDERRGLSPLSSLKYDQFSGVKDIVSEDIALLKR